MNLFQAIQGIGPLYREGVDSTAPEWFVNYLNSGAPLSHNISHFVYNPQNAGTLSTLNNLYRQGERRALLARDFANRTYTGARDYLVDLREDLRPDRGGSLLGGVRNAISNGGW